MPVRRISISVPSEVEADIKAAAEQAGTSVSTWLAEAATEKAERQAQVSDGLQAMREYEEEFGALPEESHRWARRVLAEAGIIDDDLPAVG